MHPLNEWAVYFFVKRFVLALLFHQPVVEPHQLRVFIIFQYQLAGPYFGALPQQNFSAKMALQFIERLANIGVDVDFSFFFSAAGVA